MLFDSYNGLKFLRFSSAKVKTDDASHYQWANGEQLVGGLAAWPANGTRLGPLDDAEQGAYRDRCTETDL